MSTRVASAENSNAFLYAGALVAASYLATLFIDIPVPVEASWKAAGILLFAAYAFLRAAPIAGAALVASAAGDASLALEPPIFIAGMAFFGIAHCLYVVAFALRIRRDGLQTRFYWAAALVVAASIAMFFWFMPAMGALLVPGTLYQAIITIMVATAVLSPTPPLARLGAVIFMISDTLIALGLYKSVPFMPGAIWIAYAAAQLMLAKGLADAAHVVRDDAK
ncbi:MAG: lysoplasmalogenase [Parvularculaceae bacterium]